MPAGTAEIVEIPYLEVLITHQCNLHCDGCANYSNYGLKNEMSFDENREYLRLWSKRLAPKTFRILGGEPTIHKNVLDYVELAHEIWPASERVLVSNGGFLHRHPDLPKVLRATNTALHLSFHSNDPKYLDWIRPIVGRVKNWAMEGVNVSFGDYRNFHRLHRGVGAAMVPFTDNNPIQSWRHCPSRECKNIWQGRLWKCPPITGLKPVLSRFGLEDSPDWAPYVSYDGLGLDASDEELKRFLGIGPEHICKMCPMEPHTYIKDIYNTNWKINAERVEWEGEPIDVRQFVESIAPAAHGSDA